MVKTPPIQAFYCCYLLRSTVRHASLYVGSTPNPVRRRRQHNGESKGGAVRTSKDTLRPWEMTCLVTGFPSKVAALQFEWAWQNSHLTRHIDAESRVTHAQMRDRISPKTGKVRKRNVRPRMCLSDRLLNLHALLASASFERWPLHITFFAEDVFRVWQKATADKHACSVNVLMDESSRIADAIKDEVQGIAAIDVGYGGLKEHLEKSQKLFQGPGVVRCTMCKGAVPQDGSMSVVCPATGCNAAGHLECIALAFSDQSQHDHFLPAGGKCPNCGTKHKWVDLVKEMTLRLRGEAEIKKIFKVRKPRVKKGVQAKDPALQSEDDDSDMEDAQPLADDWHYLSEEGEEPAVTPDLRSDPSPVDTEAPAFAMPSEPVIEDSDWDEAEVLL